MGLPVNAPSEALASLSSNVVRDLSTTARKISLPSGAKWAAISYRLLPGATAVANQFAKFVVNAYSDADAATKLAMDGAFVAVCQGDDVIISAPSSDPIYRIDVIAEQAVGAEKTLLTVVAGV